MGHALGNTIREYFDHYMKCRGYNALLAAENHYLLVTLVSRENLKSVRIDKLRSRTQKVSQML